MKYYFWNSIYYCMWNSCLLVFLLHIFNGLSFCYSPAFNKISKAWKFAGSRRGPDKGHHIEARADWGETQIRAPCCGGDMGLKGRIKPKAGLKSERIGLCLAYFMSVYFVKGMIFFSQCCDLWSVIISYCFYFLFLLGVWPAQTCKVLPQVADEKSGPSAELQNLILYIVIYQYHISRLRQYYIYIYL